MYVLHHDKTHFNHYSFILIASSLCRTRGAAKLIIMCAKFEWRTKNSMCMLKRGYYVVFFIHIVKCCLIIKTMTLKRKSSQASIKKF